MNDRPLFTQAEMVLGDSGSQPAGSSGGRPQQGDERTLKDGTSDSERYLEQKLHYSSDGTKLLDADGECFLFRFD